MTSAFSMLPALTSWDARVSFMPCRSVRSATRRSSRRRFQITAKKDASEKIKKLQKLCNGVEEQLSALRSDLKNIKETTKEQSVAVDETQDLHSIAREMMKRQETFFKEERAYWIDERTEWRKQETRLLQEIARLQGCIAVSHDNDPSEMPTAVTAQPSNGSENTTTSASMTDDPKAAEKMEETSANGRERNPEGMESTMHVSSSIAVAMSAVDKVDVLSDDFQEYLKTAVESSEAVNQIETIKSPPTGPPPSLTMGDDDIFWVHQLQEALVLKGYYCGDDDAGDYYFGEGTLSALLTFQACEGLKETGITDPSTWKALLGETMQPITDLPTNVTSTETSNKQTAIEIPIDTHDSTRSTKEENEKDILETKNAKEESGVVEAFPVLSEMDGGRDVHCLHVMLEIAGFSCGRDDMQWWHYGDDTINALKTFQACNGLPQSGVADESVWKALAGIGKTMSDVRVRVEQENIYEEDLSRSDRVWLLGEQRWERKL